MKRLIALITALSCSLMFAFCLTACGPDYRSNFAGDWRVVAMQDVEGNDLTSVLEQLAAANKYLTLSLSEENDDAMFDMADQHTLEGTWEPKGEAKCAIDFDGYKQIVATLSEDGNLVFEDNGQVMTCKKIEFENADTVTE